MWSINPGLSRIQNWSLCFSLTQKPKKIPIYLAVCDRKKLHSFMEHDIIFPKQPYMWTDRETSVVGYCQGHAYKHTLAPECFYSHIHATLSLKWASVPSVTLLHLTPMAGGTREDLHELVRPVLSIHCRTESEYSVCLEIASHPQPYTHIQRERGSDKFHSALPSAQQPHFM